jgi:hypothetical protein
MDINSSAFGEGIALPDINDYTQMPDGTWRSKQSLSNPTRGEFKPIPPRDNHNSDLVEDKPREAEKSLAQAIRDFVGETHGTFSANQLDNELGIVGSSKSNRRVVILRLIEERLIERVKPGCYRVKEPALPDMEWQSADTTSDLNIELLFGIHNLVEIYPRNILVIAGTTNAGKTAYLLNFIKDNMQRWDIHYFTSELSEQELKKRISKFGDGMDWQFHPHERNSNFDSVIIPDAINIIDYLAPPSGEYYAIGDQIKAMHDRLTTGIAFIAIQKKERLS